MPVDKRYPTEFPFILDAHCHMGYFRNFHIPENGVDGMLEMMDHIGIDMAAVAHHAGISSDFRLGNDEVAEAIAHHPDRMIGYCVINPNFPEEVEAELHRCFAIPGFRGIKVHPELHGDYPLDGPNYRPMWEFANVLGIPILSHTYFAGDSLDVFDRLAEAYPNVPVLLGHSGFDLGLEKAIVLANRRPNIILDLCGSPLSWNGVVELLVRSIEVEQITFGSDMPFINAARQLGALVMARIDRSAIEKIAGLNAARAFGIEHGTQPLTEAII